jgi:hypothetical protein
VWISVVSGAELAAYIRNLELKSAL